MQQKLFISLFVLLIFYPFGVTALSKDTHSPISIVVFSGSPLTSNIPLKKDSNEQKLVELLDSSKLLYNFEEYPWLRAFKLAKTKKNTFIYAISRTPERENLFQWVVPLYSFNFALYGNNSADSSLWTKDNLLAGRLSVACVKNQTSVSTSVKLASQTHQ